MLTCAIVTAFSISGWAHAHGRATSATEADDPDRLAQVVVTATRDADDPLDVAASIDAIAIDTADHSALGINVSEALGAVPGVLTRNRQNYAQDEQISIRGFGARSTFGVRGVRLYIDGIPATMPDGAGQVSHFNYDSAKRIEVLRGPFSTLYGNAAGGVIQLITADGDGPVELRSHAVAADYGTGRIGLSARGSDGALGYNVALTRFRTDGFRDHSRARRESGQAKLTWDIDGDRRLTVLANAVDIPEAQDPLGLTRAQFDADPGQAKAVAFAFDTRKTVRQQQGGAIYEQALGASDTLRVLAYAGRREVEQFLAIPSVPQANPRHAGGNIDLDGRYSGGDLRWHRDATFAGRPLQLSVGLSHERLDQERRGYENFLGERLGVRGRLRRDEDNDSRSFDRYAQALWDVAEDWTLTLGARRSAVKFEARDRYIVDGNPDDSGRADYTATTPVAGLMWRASGTTRLYAAWGRGFETPTFAELGYRNDDGSGLHFELEPARTRNYELGFKARTANGIDTRVAVFRADSDDEIAVATSAGGRTTYRNVASARRQGVEAAVTADWDERWHLTAAYTWLDARFTSPFLVCTNFCVVPDTPVTAGTRIPGLPRHRLFAEASWRGPRGWRAGLQSDVVSSVPVDDLGSESAPSYALLAASVSRTWMLASSKLRGFLRIDNLLDRDHVGSVIVNDGNGRYYEPGPGRSLMLGLQWVWSPGADGS